MLYFLVCSMSPKCWFAVSVLMSRALGISDIYTHFEEYYFFVLIFPLQYSCARLWVNVWIVAIVHYVLS